MESMYSYSSLIKSLKQEKKVDVVDFKPPHDWNVPLKNPHTLPSGAEIGTLLHKILELAPLGKLDSKEIKKIITLEVSGNEWEPWREVIENMILNALTCTFPIEETPFSLSDIDPRKVYREMEFLFPWSEDLKIEGCQISGGFLKGFIDLVFEHRGKYYILDWKSNWLGPSPEFYSRNYLEKAIHSHHYFLQAAIYQKALKQYLQMVESSLFDNIFGGVIYLFLRGISDIPSLTEDRFMGIIKVI
jgi:exodeoxyribonuclease V beta subunit